MMKSLKKLKLNQLSKAELEKREMNSLRGGGDNVCTCGCLYKGQQGSDTATNRIANYNQSIVYPTGCICANKGVVTSTIYSTHIAY